MIRIGTRDSKLAVWQAKKIQDLLAETGIDSELIKVKSEGDIDLCTPIYAMGVQGVFTRSLDTYLLSHKIDIAVHSMKDVPTQLAKGIRQAAILPRANHKDLLVYKNPGFLQLFTTENIKGQQTLKAVIATGSVRRKAQLLHRFPRLTIENLRGNLQTRMKKLQDNDWDAAIFAAAGLERIGERPENAIELNWMLPAPAQGAIMVVCRENDTVVFEKIKILNDPEAELCTKTERDFLKVLQGGCSTPISAFAEIKTGKVIFKGSILSVNGEEKLDIEKIANEEDATNLGIECAQELLSEGAKEIIDRIKKDLNQL